MHSEPLWIDWRICEILVNDRASAWTSLESRAHTDIDVLFYEVLAEMREKHVSEYV